MTTALLIYLLACLSAALAQTNTTNAGNGTANAQSNTIPNGATDLKGIANIASADGKVKGTIALSWTPGNGVEFQVDIMSGFATGAEYNWHVHTGPVTGSDCTSAGGHLNPAQAPVDCDMQKPWLCEEGNISAKKGKLIGNASGGSVFSTTDGYVRFWPEAFSVLGRSMVIHDTDNKPWACGSILSITDGTADESGAATGVASTYQTYPEKDWPKDPKAVGWVPSVQEQPDTTISIGEDGNRTITKVEPAFVWAAGSDLPSDPGASSNSTDSDGNLLKSMGGPSSQSSSTMSSSDVKSAAANSTNPPDNSRTQTQTNSGNSAQTTQSPRPKSSFGESRFQGIASSLVLFVAFCVFLT